MPLFFFIIGFLLIDSGVRGNAKAVAGQLASDVQGFLAFGAAIIILSIVGMSPTARPVAKSLLVLVFVVFLLKNGNAVVSGITGAAKATSDSTSTTATNSGVASGISSFGSTSATSQNNTTSGAPSGTGSGSTDYSGYVNTAVSLFGAYEGMG